MTPALPELRSLPKGLVLDGELVAWKGKKPYFPLVCGRVLNGDRSVTLTYVVFDVLRYKSRDLTSRPFGERHEILESSSCRAGLDNVGDV